MITGDFMAEDWIERLAGALAELATTQERYRDEFDQQHQRRTGLLLVHVRRKGPVLHRRIQFPLRRLD